MIKIFKNAICVLSALLITTGYSTAQQFPTKPVKLVVGSAAGATPDVFARIVAHKLSDAWNGSSVIVENKSGAAGTIAADYVAKSPADGYTILFSDNSAWGINPHLFSQLPYDPLKDLSPVVQVGILPLFLVVKKGVPATNVEELIAYAKKNPGKLHYGSAGPGSIHHLTGEMFKSMAGVDLVHVPYRGAPQMGTALLAGEIEMGFMGYTGAAAAIAKDKARMLGISTERRVAHYADVPTIAESGVLNFSISANVGMMVPVGTPPEVIQKISSAATEAVKSIDVAAKLATLGIMPTPSSTSLQFSQVVKADYEKFGRLVKQSGTKVDN